MIVAIYSRKSKFTGTGESVENQITVCKEYINNHFPNSEILVYEDEGFSGGDTDRPQFQKLIKDAENSKFNLLICYRLDRISRNISDFANTIEMLEEKNISFVSVREQFDTSTPMGRAMLYIASVFAQLERETIAERIKDNMYQLARTGRWLGGNSPTGFDSEPIVYIDENMKERKMYTLKAIPEELEIVKHVFEKYLELQSLAKVEAYSFQKDFMSKNGKYLGKTALKFLLTNPVYAKGDKYMYDYFESLEANIATSKDKWNGTKGIMAYNKRLIKKNRHIRNKEHSEWIVSLGKHKGIIDGKDWIKVQKLMEKNREKAPRNGTSRSAMLSGILKCGFCSSPMHIKYGRTNKDTGEKLYYYTCSLKQISKRSKCQCKNLNGEKTDEQIIDDLKNIIDNGLLQSIDKQKKQLSNRKSQSKTIEKQIEKNQRSIDNLVKQLSENESSTITKYIIAEMEKLEKENNKLKAELEKDTTAADTLNLEIFRDSLIHFRNTIDDVPYDLRKNMIKAIVNEIVWDEHSFAIDLLQ